MRADVRTQVRQAVGENSKRLAAKFSAALKKAMESFKDGFRFDGVGSLFGHMGHMGHMGHHEDASLGSSAHVANTPSTLSTQSLLTLVPAAR